MIPCPSLTHDNNKCPFCWTHLSIRLCEKIGPNHKKCFLLCVNNDLHPGQKPYWHFWSRHDSDTYQNGRLPSLHPPQQTQDHSASRLLSGSSSPSLLASLLPASQEPAPRRKEVLCWEKGCKSSRVALKCMSQRCKEHCIVLNNGTCPVTKHHPSEMSNRQRRKAEITRPISRRPRTQDPHWNADFQDMLQDIGDSASFSWEHGPALQRAQIDKPARDLDQALRSSSSRLVSSPPSPSSALFRPSPELDEREASELRLAMALSLAATASTGESASTSAAATPSAGPQRRVQASSVIQRTTLPKSQPRITTQLNPTWMAQASGTRPVNNTFNMPKRSQPKAAVDLATLHRFTLIYWDHEEKDALILGVTECASWPNFRLSQAPNVLALLGCNLGAVEFYDVRYRLWVRVELDYIHVLTNNTYLFLRRVGVSGHDQQRLIDQFVNSPGPQHIRYNLPAEREAVRSKLKARKLKQRVLDSDSEVEVIESSTMKSEADDEVVVVVERPVLRIVTGGTIADPIRLDQHLAPSSSSSSSPSSSSFSYQSPSTAPTTPLSSLTPPPSAPEATTRWPKGMYAVDMANGFMQMEAPELQHVPIAGRFQQVFKTDWSFVPRTYADARLRWTRGSERLRTAAYEAGRTDPGLWSAYAAQVPLKK
ncbi:hypothetical protein B0H11DRAFT_2269258 [Mycena galericulata]|nr:hypothetical protein B0H11DRAFT_2269258 [Mycena galericulata]